MPAKYTYQYVSDYFKENGCKLLSTEYTDTRTPLLFICSCGKEIEIEFRSFKNTKKCRYCTNTFKYTYEEVKKYFEDNNCKLMSKDYKNSSVKLKYLCLCGNESDITFHHFKNGVRCKKCPKTTMKFPEKRYTYEDVRNIFKDKNCQLLSTKYINNTELLEYICHCGYKDKISLKQFNNNVKCQNCRKNRKYDYSEVKQKFEENGCILLSKEYINSTSKLDYICKCGEKATITYKNFINNKFCQKCGNNKKYSLDEVKNTYKEKGCEMISKEYNNCTDIIKYKCKCGNIHENKFCNFKNDDNLCKDCGFEKQEKSSRKFKDYIFPSGKKIKIQGHEDIALDDLIKTYKEEDIITERRFIPKIFYNDIKNKEKNRRYYPDIYVKSQNLLIEVKSEYTYNYDLTINLIKCKACVDRNFKYEFWIYDKKMNKRVLKY